MTSSSCIHMMCVKPPLSYSGEGRGPDIVENRPGAPDLPATGGL